MKICCLSDMHGHFPKIEECDLVLICGDSISLNAQNNPNLTQRWYLSEFKPWAYSLPCDKVLFIAGNHSLFMDRSDIWVKRNFGKHDKVTYLENEFYEYKGLRIFGTPYCKMFGNWAFMKTDDILRQLFSKIPENLDILMSHDAPYNTCDLLLEPLNRPNPGHIGSIPLREEIDKKKPKISVFGHLHSGQKGGKTIGDTTFYNVSVLSEQYELIYEPTYIYL